MAPLGRDVGTEGGHVHPITLLAEAQACACRPAAEICGWGASSGRAPAAKPRSPGPSVDGMPQNPSGLRPAKAMKPSPHTSIYSLAAEERASAAPLPLSVPPSFGSGSKGQPRRPLQGTRLLSLVGPAQPLHKHGLSPVRAGQYMASSLCLFLRHVPQVR